MAKKNEISKNLISAVDDINEAVELEEAIDIDGMTEEEVINELKEVAVILDKGDKENLAVVTLQTLEEIGALKAPKADKPKAAPKASKKTTSKEKPKAVAKDKPKTAEKQMKVPKTTPKPKADTRDKPTGPKLYKARQAREGGVIQAIFSIIEKNGPLTREKILDRMVKKFPAREPSGMALTINQETSPAALYYRKPLEVDEKGKFSIK